MKCYDVCTLTGENCKNKDCRLWIDYEKDFNCTEISVQKYDKLVFREIGDRLKLTPSRVKQIENEALNKLNTRLNVLMGDT
jgi:LytS/YehU family sensor histidine kinase